MNVSSLLSPTAQATLLLTSYFSKASSETAKPLTNAEWGRFAWWLKEKSATPADLLVTEPKALLQDWHDGRISTERIIELLNRGHSLALAMERWQRAGLWVVTRSDPEYPKRLKARLKTDCPPVLFGCGNKALLNTGGLAVIGSRNASEPDLAFTDQVGAKAASEGIAVVSGGARGVDETVMLGAVRQGGVVIGVMADSLLKAATSSKWRKGLMDGHAVLVSPFYPEAGFSAGNAMARNKYIYCLADSSLVIHSGKKGGTLNGAEENLKQSWVPLWVKQTTDKDAANADLVAKGGRWLDADMQAFKIADLIDNESSLANQVKEPIGDLFSLPAQPELFAETDSNPEIESELVDFYQLFTAELQRLAEKPVTFDALLEITQLHKSQLTEWLKRAVDDGVVKKLNRPVSYQIKNMK
ncbi:DNA-processing protein DprA [Marinospirillum alkaliphilum]|uniref:Predicted Rossmann fold nucleotide-binding protein DprA/Smf involved in DNA uptake n=1 Tax=Marinospirillum alkaliphilum DSM 21637 TaxID=1122209 RepID=A0A1K1VWD0_9GAMM|nr:DNA-processing protein DprA [Marinospirillum alkaliphilum]SFX29147.1 Predicted Rossmann fold nucleotide-binding protein DprA/Smf involved in DNA uptake [Marinospirillum alkaliphilum DSM 21637]